jgi:hypothetical protein
MEIELYLKNRSYTVNFEMILDGETTKTKVLDLEE